jgi:hypothetical protein
MVTLASNFSLLGDVAAWWLLLLSAFVSVFPSMRAHWAGPLLAAPALLCNLMLERSIAAGSGMGDPSAGQWLTFLAPAIIGSLSFGVWGWAVWRRGRGNRDGT